MRKLKKQRRSKLQSVYLQQECIFDFFFKQRSFLFNELWKFWFIVMKFGREPRLEFDTLVCPVPGSIVSTFQYYFTCFAVSQMRYFWILFRCVGDAEGRRIIFMICMRCIPVCFLMADCTFCVWTRVQETQCLMDWKV